jgi:hypothetical protein
MKMNLVESARVLTGIAEEINNFVAPMGGHVCGEITVTAGRFAPAMQITIGFAEDLLINIRLKPLRKANVRLIRYAPVLEEVGDGGTD